MEENKEFKEVLSILEDVHGWNDTNELTQIQKELVNDVISSVKILNIPIVTNFVCDAPKSYLPCNVNHNGLCLLPTKCDYQRK